MQTAIQLYTVRDVEKPLPEIIADVGEADFDGVEFAYRVEDADRDAVRTALDDAGLQAASAHIGIDAIEADLDAVVAAADTLGYDDVVVPWLDPEHWETVEAVEATAARLSGLAEELSEAGLTMHYHNHDQEFVETDEGVAFELLADQTDFMLELDAGWALAGGADPIELLHRYGDRISHVHLKDVNLDSDEVPALGEGDLDIPAVAEAAHEIGAEWLVYENDQPRDPVAAIPHGADVLSRHV
jgi:sugar phosphate isomerase/epimerase